MFTKLNGIHFDQKSNLNQYLKKVSNVKSSKWDELLFDPAVEVAFRILRAMEIERQITTELVAKNILSESYLESFTDFPIINEEQCISAFFRAYIHIVNFNLTSSNLDHRAIKKLLKKNIKFPASDTNNACLFFSEPKLGTSLLFDGSGPKPRGDGW